MNIAMIALSLIAGYAQAVSVVDSGIKDVRVTTSTYSIFTNSSPGYVQFSSSQPIFGTSSIIGSVTVTPGTGTWATSQQGSLTVTQGTASLTSNAWLVAHSSTYTTNTFSGTSSSPSINIGLSPMKMYSIQVLGTGATPTSWDVRLEGSVNNSTFTTILQHTQAIGDGILLYSGANMYPSLYIRSRVAAVSLGGASSIAVTILGTQ